MEQAAKDVRALLLENTDAKFCILLQAEPVWDREMCLVSFLYHLMRWQLPLLIKLTIRARAVAHWPAVGPGIRYPNKVEERPFWQSSNRVHQLCYIKKPKCEKLHPFCGLFFLLS